MWVPVGLLVFSVTTGGIAVYLATSDPSFMVEEDYYQKGLDWDQAMAQKRVNEQLGWKINTSVVDGQLRFNVTDADDAPIDGGDLEYLVFHNARASQQSKGNALGSEAGDGVYTADVDFDRAGTWVVRYRLQRGEELYVSETRMELK